VAEVEEKPTAERVDRWVAENPAVERVDRWAAESPAVERVHRWVAENPTVERIDRWVALREGFPDLPNRWLVSVAMAAAVGSAVFLALEPNGALGLVGQMAGSLQNLGGVARDLLDRLVIGSRAASL
jgi:hypothetical protein